jgi:hypothetical protein
LVGLQTLTLAILVRVQASQPIFSMDSTRQKVRKNLGTGKFFLRGQAGRVEQVAEGVVVVGVGDRAAGIGQRTHRTVAVVVEVKRLRQALLSGEILAILADALQRVDIGVRQFA